MKRLWRPAALALGLLAAGLAVNLLSKDASATLQVVGARGAGVFTVVAAFLCAVGLPRQIVAYAAAYVFGLAEGAALALMAQFLGCLLDFGWARALGRGWAEHQIRRRLGGRLDRLDRFIRANPFTATLMLRLLPVGNNLLLNLVAGLSGVAAAPFLLASTIGYVPQTLVFAVLGSGVRIEETTRITIGAVLLILSATMGVVLLRRFRTLLPT